MPSHPWIDLTIPLCEGMTAWHDDPPFRSRRVLDAAKGGEATLTALSLGSHTGTHLDAPSHLLPGGRTIDEMPLDVGIGLARVIQIDEWVAVTAQALVAHRIRRGERILLKTRNSNGPWYAGRFREDYVALTAGAAQHLADRGVHIVGIDALSVDLYQDAQFHAHRALLGANVWIVEGLNLSDAPAGRCDLVCLPLRITGSDGAPARAALRPKG